LFLAEFGKGFTQQDERCSGDNVSIKLPHMFGCTANGGAWAAYIIDDDHPSGLADRMQRGG
jgi:hypothetical protein